MRKVKIVSEDNFFESNDELEKLINEAFREIEESGGKVIKTKYCASEMGYVKEAVIEYDVCDKLER